MSAVPPLVALTGGLGAGKSTALAALERLGAAVISTDDVVHDLYRSEPVVKAVSARFGPAVAPSGVISREAVAARVFADPREREWLEALLWPLVRERISAWREATIAASLESPLVSPPSALVVEVPLLFESGGEGLYDASITILADDALRRARARARGHQDVSARERRQLTQEQKAARSTFVVVNDGTIEELESKLSELLVMLARG